ncbi:CHASE2 domain-containing serine/threonine-protein kinase [Solimonas variicoloris]|uniref:CHASE2 domain-containing serine/threonine-protein kinase n=1 Tax=Solimonas variicoloris TaxID=254408 RepID=UPI0004780E5D|nr:serine/threonine-protein kinase [Solimonas variicoloris]
MKEKLWTRDWFAALAFAVVFAVLAYGVFAESFQSLERYTYDLGVRSRERAPSERIAIVAIDDASIRNLGRWPWPRTLQAQLIDRLRAGGAKVIGNTALYLEAERNAGSDGLQALADELRQSPLSQQIPAEIETFGVMLDDGAPRTATLAAIAKSYRESALARDYRQLIGALAERIETAARAGGGGDDALAAALSAQGRTVLPMVFELGRPQGRPDALLPDYVQRNALTRIEDRVGARADGALPLQARALQAPIAELGADASAIGHLNVTPDSDGAVRYEPLVVQYYDAFYPSLSLMLAATALNLQPADIVVRLGEGVELGELSIATTPALRMYTQFYADRDGRPAFPVDSAYDLLSGKLPPERYRDKIVLIGTTAAGTGDSFATPVGAAMAPVLTLAHSVSSVLQQDFLTRPLWSRWAQLAVLLLLAAYLAFALPRLRATAAALATLALVVALLGTQLGLMIGRGLWLPLTLAALFVAVGHLFMTVKKFNITERLKQSSDIESAESNRMLGLAFQGQGQLDMAFEKFRRVQPVDDKLLDLVYNLALDFERKRQFGKAEVAYQYIAGFQREFRDVQQKLSRAKKLSETVILGSHAAAAPGGTLVLDATEQLEKPMLGRYQVERELGKGAMGVVYAGRDPKIGRQVAIKTLALSQEFEPDELAGVKERFFREAETAGRLAHPHIVSIYDAGEEHDLAYIAMEFIRGHDLTRHTKPNNLLPVAEVLRLAAEAADALDYAHANGIVHRDIKPANMMLLESTRALKLMDFGIARITDASKTKTGLVLGTPSYMSPEQLSGKKVDGRSDLFSLGVTLYQLLTGALPFRAESMATLMFKIANEPHLPPQALRPDLPAEVDAILARLLDKDPARRHARGADLARELRAAAGGLSG